MNLFISLETPTGADHDTANSWPRRRVGSDELFAGLRPLHHGSPNRAPGATWSDGTGSLPSFGARLVGEVAGVTAHIERRHDGCPSRAHSIPSGGNRGRGFPSRRRDIGFRRLILVVRWCADRGKPGSREPLGDASRPLMSAAFLSAWHVRAKRRGRSGDQLDACDVFIDPDLMAAQTARGHGGMYRLTFGLILVALKAFGKASVFLSRGTG